MGPKQDPGPQRPMSGAGPAGARASDAPPRAAGWLAGGPLGSFAAVWIVGAIFCVASLVAVYSGYALHDEGLLTWHFGSLIAHEPAAGLFFQKARPGISPLYAPASVLGFRVFATLHVLVAGAAIVMLGDTARRLGHTLPVVAAFGLACSPLFGFGAAAGHTNTDGVAALCLCIWLWQRDKPLLAGIPLGMGIFMRSELAAFAVVLLLWALKERAFLLVAGAAVFPVLYALAGSVYHHDLLWMVHFPPALSQPVAEADWRTATVATMWIRESSQALLALAPMGAVVLLLRLRALRGLEIPLAIGALVYVAAIRLFPLLGWFNFDDSPRYLMLALPALALLGSRAVDELCAGREGRASMAVLGVALCLGVINGRAAGDLTLAVVAAVAVALAGHRRGAHRAALSVLVAMSLALGVTLWLRASKRGQAAEFQAVIEVLGDPDISQAPTIVTNDPLLGVVLDRRGVPHGVVQFVLQTDTRAEIERLLHHENGQRDAVFSALDRQFYGRIIAPQALDHRAWPAGTVVVWRGDSRLESTIDTAAWAARTRWLIEGRVGILEDRP